MPWTSSIVDANDFRTCKALFDALAVDSMRITTTGVNRIEKVKKEREKYPKRSKSIFANFEFRCFSQFKNKQNWTWIFFLLKNYAQPLMENNRLLRKQK